MEPSDTWVNSYGQKPVADGVDISLIQRDVMTVNQVAYTNIMHFYFPYNTYSTSHESITLELLLRILLTRPITLICIIMLKY